jgi:hypothetical protein
LAIAIARNKKRPKTVVISAKEAFALFEKHYKEAFPEDRTFTWGEAVMKAANRVKLVASESIMVQNSLRQFEAYRYGEISAQQVDTQPILKLATALRKNK